MQHHAPWPEFPSWFSTTEQEESAAEQPSSRGLRRTQRASTTVIVSMGTHIDEIIPKTKERHTNQLSRMFDLLSPFCSSQLLVEISYSCSKFQGVRYMCWYLDIYTTPHEMRATRTYMYRRGMYARMYVERSRDESLFMERSWGDISVSLRSRCVCVHRCHPWLWEEIGSKNPIPQQQEGRGGGVSLRVFIMQTTPSDARFVCLLVVYLVPGIYTTRMHYVLITVSTAW